MDTSNQETVGKIVRRYRTARALSQENLAGAVGVDHSHISYVERDQRGLSPQIAKLIASELKIAGDDLTQFRRLTGLADFDPDGAQLDDTTGASIEEDLRALMTTASKQIAAISRVFLIALQRPRYLTTWIRGRVLELRCHTSDAFPLLRDAAMQAYADFDRGTVSELTGIILLEGAVVHAIVGQFGQADDFARMARIAARDLHKQDPENKRLRMGLARAILVQQTHACFRGDLEGSDVLHAEAEPFLISSEDQYGWAKTFYLLAFSRFRRGHLSEARRYAEAAVSHAREIDKVKLDPLWMLRDGVYFGPSWWRVLNASLLLDILACQGVYGRPIFERARAEYLVARNTAWWARRFPPFVPRYEWVMTLAEHGIGRAERVLVARLEEARACGYLMYQPDMLISYGDFLMATGSSEAAAGRYAEAEQFAETHGFVLLAESARGRRLGENYPPLLLQSDRRGDGT